MRLLYYAIGGGLGHLVRARAFLHTLGLERDAAVLSASEHARDRRVLGDLAVVPVPRALERDRAAFRVWLLRAIERCAPDVFCTDVFPAGILGELCDLPPLGVAFWHVARRLRWEAYAPSIVGAPPRNARTFRVETLHAAQQEFLQAHSERIDDIALDEPAAMHAPVAIAAPYWLVVHSGPAAEVAELVAYADEIRRVEKCDASLLVVTADAPAALPPGTRVLDAHPATPYFAAAQRIVSAAGFNVMRQARPWRDKHLVLPMPRRFDDQAERARAERTPAPSPPPRTVTART